MTGRKPSAADTPPPETMVHDPAAQRAHDLDDPFFDEKIQKRVARLIADSVRDKRSI